jgi:hypothetical protein
MSEFHTTSLAVPDSSTASAISLYVHIFAAARDELHIAVMAVLLAASSLLAVLLCMAMSMGMALAIIARMAVVEPAICCIATDDWAATAIAVGEPRNASMDCGLLKTACIAAAEDVMLATASS